MAAQNISENEAENKSVRIHYLEQQVRMMRNELRYIRKDLVPQEDLRRLTNLSDKLNELNTLLYELRNNYKRLQQPRMIRNGETSLRKDNYLKQSLHHEHNMTNSRPQEERNFPPRHQLQKEDRKLQEKYVETINNDQGIRNANGMKSSESRRQEMNEEKYFQPRKHLVNEFDQSKNQSAHEKLHETEEPIEENKQTVSSDLEAKTSYKSCQQLMNDIKSPGSILGNYLVRLQDFRTDPELRRQRLEKKLQEKLALQQQKQILENKTKVSDKGNESMHYSSKESFLGSTKNYETPKETLNDRQQSETQNNKCKIIEWDTTPIPPEVPRSIKPLIQRSIFTETGISIPPKPLDFPKETAETQKFTSETQTDSNEFFDLDMTQLQNSQTPDDPNLQFTSTSQTTSTQQTDSSSSLSKNLPLIHKNLQDVVYSIVQNIDTDTVALTVVLESNNLYHINISVTTTGQSLSCLYATEAAIQQAKNQNLFKNLLTFFVVSSDNTLGQKDLMLGHTFEFNRRET